MYYLSRSKQRKKREARYKLYYRVKNVSEDFTHFKINVYFQTY